ncbi:MAG: amidohydrolase family protein [Burkholderiaceae bacterium]
MTTSENKPYLRIATEEAFATKEQLALFKRVLDQPNVDKGFAHLMGFYMSSPSERAQHIMRCLVDLDELRIAHMDASGIDIQVLALTSPGAQIMDRETAVSFIPNANDELAEAIKRHPTRFAGMVALAPQDPAASAKELQRCADLYGMRSAVINSHTQGEYLSDKKFWPIFEAAEALNMPIYLHPNSLPAQMIDPFIEAGLDGAIYGFGVETGLHALRIITSGVFDQFPNLKMVLGHMGEALPFWAYRLDYMHNATVRSKRYEAIHPTKRKPSEYLKENFYITNSGVAWGPALQFTQAFMGTDRVLYAMDYPYQYLPEEVDMLEQVDMTPEVKRQFFQDNAVKVFDLKI